MKDKGRRDCTLNPTTHGPTNGVQFTICLPTKGARIEQPIHSAGAELRYPPPYSPDMNPIDNAFSELKANLRKLAERTVAGLIRALAHIFKPAKCTNHFAACGYDTT